MLAALIGLSIAVSPADLVNPFIGASTSGAGGGLGKTFPGAATPFGMVQLSPDTVTGGDNGPGYSYEHKTIEGFSFTHMSGIGWYGDLGNLLVMPTTGPLQTNSGREAEKIDGYRSTFSHDTEVAKPGYYAVTLNDYQVRAEAVAAPHAGILRFTFPEYRQSRIQIDLARRIGGTSVEQEVEVVDEHTIKGWMRCTPDGGGWGDGAGKPNYTVYFYAQVSKPMTNYGTWSATPPAGQRQGLAWAGSREFQTWAAKADRHPMAKHAKGPHLGFYTEFASKSDEVVLFKAGISFCSIDGARKNLEKDIPDWNFEAARRRTTELWNRALGKAAAIGGSHEDQVIFNTALYHSMIDPRDCTDVDGQHPSGDGKARVDKSFTYRTIFSGWDVFRSQMPLQTLLNPSVVNDQINSLVQLADLSKQGYLERWEFLNAYSGCMVGNPAISVIADAYQKGIRDFPIEDAYRLCRATIEKFGNGSRGYVPNDISETLEYGYTEWCQSELARQLGKRPDQELYASRSQAYRKIFDPSVGWFRAKDDKGSWLPWPSKGPLEWVWCVESNPLQQGWFVPHDAAGLASLLGGNDAAAKKLDQFFAETPKGMNWNDHYNHANEPVHHAAFLFNAWGKPWLTQKWAHEILRQAYHNDVAGLCGNDDVGQMSAWYVLSAMGFHPLAPGNGRYEICGPLFDQVMLRLDPKYAKGKQFVVKAHRSHAGNVYIQSATLNGKPFNRSWISHEEIVAGGTLAFEMGDKPNEKWGVR